VDSCRHFIICHKSWIGSYIAFRKEMERWLKSGKLRT
jgi:hypothetical protein